MNLLCPICNEPFLEKVQGICYCVSCGLGMDVTSADGIYGDEYLIHYLLYETTEFTKTLMRQRMNFVQEYAPIVRTDSLLDYGCGAGTFGDYVNVNSLLNVYSYDPFLKKDHSFIQYLKEHKKFNVITFWDSFEHIRRLGIIPLLRGDYIFLTIPIIDQMEKGLKYWKHYVPGEHVWYFSTNALVALFGKWNYKLIGQSDFEERLRSSGIKSFCFKHGG